ncbi:MAG: LysM peptidoglycan-binding domain-containing protein, partial [Acidiferrobacterales bacterium]|nr:LysM peptidoglycan-binding domain-containing protein [Acidiferrobacterales bacterium]
MMTRSCFIVIAALAATVAYSADAPSSFTVPAELESATNFWKRVYTEVDTNGGFIHDDRHLDVVYEVVRFPSERSERGRRSYVKKAKQRYRNILLRLARGEREGLSDDEQRVLALWPDSVSKQELRAASYRLRFQLGQADRFRAGLMRAGAWEPYISETLAQMQLPPELVALPHVESSYNPTARSHAGALGLWQLTRSTGRRYLRINATVDERLDPHSATIAAARLLKHNRDVTGSWPLAITAYNHGAAGMRRAVRQLGTHDIATIVREYKSRTFGFSSRNFYAAFLAAVDVHFNTEKYFGRLERDHPVQTELVEVPAYMSVATLEDALGIDRVTLREHNPALRYAVWRGARHVPRGYKLRLPYGALDGPANALLARVTPDQRYQGQPGGEVYRVRYGDTVGQIATRFGVSEHELVAFNGLASRHHIRAGQRLHLPPSAAVSGSMRAARPATHAASPADGFYEVQGGDTLSVIARRFGVSEQALVQANALSNRHRISAGQVLRVAIDVLDKTGAAPAVDTMASVVEAAPATDSEPEMTPTEVASVEAAEPASAREAEAIGPTLPTVAHPALAADPSDYTVSSDGTIEVQAAETLGHYAEWLEVRASALRRLNGMRYRQPVVVGRRLRLEFTRTSLETFEQRRLAYHRALQETFFTQYRISDTHEHVVQRGELVWILSQRRYNVPLWLLRQYNPDLDLNAVLPGITITIP